MSIKEAQVTLEPVDPLDLQSYAPHFLTTIANRWGVAASRKYLRDFAIGVAEWRVVAALSVLGTATSLEVVNLLSMDAGAVSRAMRTLGERGFVVPVAGRFKGRSKPFELTDAGRDLYVRVRDVAYRQEDFLLRALDSKERQLLLDMLRRIHAGLSEL